MYLRHFSLSAQPFALTPQTALYYPATAAAQALAALQAALRRGSGILKVTGEVGTGKTLLCRLLLEALHQHVELAYISIPPRGTQLLDAVAAEFGLDGHDQPMAALQAHLLEQHRQGRQTVLVIDEAQGMDAAALEAVRLLSNLETRERTLLQIVLFAQPELDAQLARQDRRQLRQRIAYAFRTVPLNATESRAYVQHRLAAVGGQPEIVSAAALRRLARAAGGVPRLLNILADRALLAAYADDCRTVLDRHARAAVAEQDWPAMRLSLPRWLNWPPQGLWGGAACAALAVAYLIVNAADGSVLW